MSAIGRFGKYLEETFNFEPEMLANALERTEGYGYNSPRALANVLVSEFRIEHDRIYNALAKYYAFDEMHVDVERMDSAQLCQMISIHDQIDQAFLDKLFQANIVPYRLVGKRREMLQVLAANTSEPILHEIELQTEFKSTDVCWCPLATITALIYKTQHPSTEMRRMLCDTTEEIIESSQMMDGVDDQAVDEAINKSYLVELFENVLTAAVKADASDIHVVPSGKYSVELYLRIDGRLLLWHRQENTPPEALAAVIKDRSVGVDRFARDKGQDGYAQRTIDGHLIRFRISILPIISSEYERRFESIVIRVIDDRKVISDFHKLGFQPHAEREFVKSINTSKGIVIVTGPTGSGKSTTLMAALSHIINPSLNVLTCEDPVEYVIKGARQLKIGYNMSFDEAMRLILRHDPDVVMVGEIRDKVTADIAVKLANTGHLTFTTLHTNDAPSAITRLFKMGVEPFLLAYSINIIIAQRLVRKLCDKCKKPLTEEIYPAALELGITMEDLQSGKIFMPVGCQYCTDGFRGRINIAEALYFYPEVRAELIRSSTDIDEDRIREIAEKHGMLSMRQSGIQRIRAGQTSITEVLYAAAED